MINWSRLPSLSALRAFSAYVQSGSVAEAGAALNVSHAAISQQLRGLEAYLGVPLFDRSSRALELTPEGEDLARALQDGFGASRPVSRPCLWPRRSARSTWGARRPLPVHG